MHPVQQEKVCFSANRQVLHAYSTIEAYVLPRPSSLRSCWDFPHDPLQRQGQKAYPITMALGRRLLLRRLHPAHRPQNSW